MNLPIVNGTPAWSLSGPLWIPDRGNGHFILSIVFKLTFDHPLLVCAFIFPQLSISIPKNFILSVTHSPPFLIHLNLEGFRARLYSCIAPMIIENVASGSTVPSFSIPITPSSRKFVYCTEGTHANISSITRFVMRGDRAHPCGIPIPFSRAGIQ